MGTERLDNAAPVVHTTKSRRQTVGADELDRQLAAGVEDPVDVEEIFDYIRDINDPEHPYTLEQLNVVQEELITVVDERRPTVDGAGEQQRGTSYVDVSFTPTIPHCSMATLIGLAIYVKLRRSVDPAFKVLVHITPGSHATEEAINRQLADKERVAAAMENPNLMQTINQCLRPQEYN